MRNINIPATVKQLTQFIKQSVHAASFSQAVVAVSGGVDSATSVSLAVRALGKENIHAVLLPYKNWHEEAKTHARQVLKNLKISEKNIHEVDIGSLVDSFVSTVILGKHEVLTPESGFWTSQNDKIKLRLGNIMARVRMIVLYDLARKLKAFTRFGDEASDIEPIRQLYKTEVWELAKYLKVPQEIVTKAPTAGLWPGQTDEGELGFTYKQADEVLYGLFDLKLSPAKLIKRGLDKALVNQVQTWVKKVDFKHHLPLVALLPKTR